MIFLLRITFHLGRAKEVVRGGMGGESLNEGYFCKIPIIKQDTNFITQSLVRQTSNTTIAITMPKNLYAGIFKWFWAVLPGQKQLSLYIFNEQYASKLSALKIVESALNELKMYSCKLKMVYWKLKTFYWKMKMYSWKLKMVVLFSYGKVKDKNVFNKDQISSGEGKRKGQEGGMGENP